MTAESNRWRSNKMLNKMLCGIAPTLLMMGLAQPVAHAQSAPAAFKETTIIATGCLAKADAPHEYTLTDRNGRTYRLESTQTIGLKHRVGRIVNVTAGVPHKYVSRAGEVANPADLGVLQADYARTVRRGCS
jgi:hypothetical protein